MPANPPAIINRYISKSRYIPLTETLDVIKLVEKEM